MSRSYLHSTYLPRYLPTACLPGWIQFLLIVSSENRGRRKGAELAPEKTNPKKKKMLFFGVKTQQEACPVQPRSTCTRAGAGGPGDLPYLTLPYLTACIDLRQLFPHALAEGHAMPACLPAYLPLYLGTYIPYTQTYFHIRTCVCTYLGTYVFG